MNDESTETPEQEEAERKGAIHAVTSFVVALLIVLAGAGIMIFFVVNKVKVDPEAREDSDPTVAVSPVEVVDHEVKLKTQGVVISRQEVVLSSEVGGKVVFVSPELVEGGKVVKGEVLARVDDANYLAAVEAAKAAVADAELMLEQEEAKKMQAQRDWEKLGQGKAPPLVRREPQIRSAKARVASAESELARAERDLKRTTIVAPFDGRVRRADIEIGALVSPGSRVAEIFADQNLEVRLPFPLRDFGFLQDGVRPEFELTATIGAETRSWPAVLDRIEGEVERATLSGYGIAKVLPAEGTGDYPPVGLFVDAVVPAGTLENVVEVPREVVRGRDDVWVVNDGELWKRQPEVLRSEREFLITRGGFEPGDQLVRTRLEAPLDGMKVEVKTTEAESAEGAPKEAMVEPESAR
ncbi:RND family efflux transporter, MFP subunit [Haloferula helveola]|uniref:RND family efflux transporter, MFP subunit n=1 Tax=Haloferula helveola TaxID=490095 RepID=A0ABM7RQF2_9BACT|nr:RND family efflux transporter, MFP subunit [Haloferula helveola]